MNLGSITLRNPKLGKSKIMCSLRSQPYFILLTCMHVRGVNVDTGYEIRKEARREKKEAPRKKRAQLEGHMQHKRGKRPGNRKVQEGGSSC